LSYIWKVKDQKDQSYSHIYNVWISHKLRVH
jgi:hypothetical protein